MFAKKRRMMAIPVILAVMLMLITGLATLAGASTVINGVVVGGIPTIASPGYVNLASIRYAESGASGLHTGDIIEVTLPLGLEFQTGLAAGSYYEATGNLSIAYSLSADKQNMTYTITRTSMLNEASLLLKLPVVVFSPVPSSGNVVVSVSTNSPSLGGGSFGGAQYGTPSVEFNVTPATIPVLSKYGTNPQTVARTLRFAENSAGALRDGSLNKIILALPKGVFWAQSSYAVQAYPALPAGVTVTATRHSGDSDELHLVLSGGRTTTATTFSIVNPAVNVYYLAALGDLSLKVDGQGSNAAISGNPVLAAIADFDVTVRRQANMEPFQVMAGRQGEAMANVEIMENVAASLQASGTVTVTLPEGMKFASAPAATYSGLTGTQPQIEAGSSNRTITMSVLTHSTMAGRVLIHFNAGGSVLVAPTFSGDVNVSVAGTAGASGSVTMAQAVKPVEVSAASVSNIPEGATVAAGGDIVITETGAGRLTAGVLTLDLPVGVTFSSTPTVSRTTGNMTLGMASLSSDGTRLVIPVNSRGTVTGSITVSDIQYQINRSRWNTTEGKIILTVGGNSLIDGAVSTAFTAARDKVTVLNAQTGAPGPARVAVFTIGSLTYTLAGETLEMDQAPLIVSGRTLLPLRFAASAAGVLDDDILWDPVKRTVTLLRGDRVAQVAIGSKTIMINGAPVTMDVAPEIINGRTMLPIRWIGLALHAEVDWDDASKTVTIEPN
jgi:hypothetical protein